MKLVKKIFFVLLLCVTIGTLSTGCSTKNLGNNDLNTKKSSGAKTYKLNEDIYVTTGEEKYRIKFTNVTETDYRATHSSQKADRVVIVEYEYENISKENNLYISDTYFKLYDKKNNNLMTYPVVTDVKYPKDAAKGETVVANVAYALNNSDNYIKVDFYDNIILDTVTFSAILEW